MAGCGRDLIIYAPGSRGNTVDAEKYCEPLEEKYGYSTFSYDLRGIGKSKGSQLDLESQIRDIQYVIDVAISKMEERDKGPDRVILIGHSMGAVASLTIGIQNPKVDLVFAMSSLYSIEDFLEEEGKKKQNQSLVSIGKGILGKIKEQLSAPYWFKKFIGFVTKGKTLLMPKYHLNDEIIKKVFIIHGMKDVYVPFEKTGKKLIEKYNLSKDRYLLIKDGGHSFEGKQVEEILDWIHSKV
ncbi:MAG: alpha/beta hydrolase [Promethearchaeota archaeon]|nr:MAG: alpha/beta hydrolase [Candidatus Lokiarchaeota archaeon]